MMGTAKKSPVPPKTINVVTARTGAKHPERMPTEATSPYELRGWQREAHAKLHNARLRRLVAPTGAGKSVAMEALALTDMSDGYRCIISVPMTDIIHGFARRKTIRVGRRRLEWAPSVVTHSTTAQVLDWLGDRRNRTPLVCTHSTLRNVHAQLAADGRLRLLRKLSVFIDEGHHSGDADVAEQSNRLAAFVRDMQTIQQSRLLITTATWLRNDGRSVVYDLSSFTLYRLTTVRYLAEVAQIETISFRYLIGPEMACYEQLLREDAQRPTIVYQRLGCSRASKLATLKGLTAIAKRYRAPYLDLINDGPERAAREHAFYSTGQEDVASVFALSKANEGSDWSRCSRELFLAPRGSMPQMVQMIGRALRRRVGKRDVQINIVIPPNVPPDQLRDYLKALCATFVLAQQFRAPRIRGPRDDASGQLTQPASARDTSVADAAHELLSDPDFVAEIAPYLIDCAADDDSARLLKRIGKLAGRYPGLEDPDVQAAVLVSVAGTSASTRRVLGEAVKGADDIIMDFELEESIVDRLRVFSAALGADTLARVRLRFPVNPTPEQRAEGAEMARQWAASVGITNVSQWKRTTIPRPPGIHTKPWKLLGCAPAEFFGREPIGPRRAAVKGQDAILLVQRAREWAKANSVNTTTAWNALGKKRPREFTCAPWKLIGKTPGEFFETRTNVLGKHMTDREKAAVFKKAFDTAVENSASSRRIWYSVRREQPERLPHDPWVWAGLTESEFFEKVRAEIR